MLCTGLLLPVHSGAETLFDYDEEGNLISETSNGKVVQEYIYLDGVPIALVNDQNEVHAIESSHLGAPERITDSSQNVVWETDYEPFGKTNVTTSAIAFNLRFPGQYHDEETSLHYNYFRDYDHSTGRYGSPDQIGILYSFRDPNLQLAMFGRQLGQEEQRNLIAFINPNSELNHLYGYAKQNPINIDDPFGLADSIDNLIVTATARGDVRALQGILEGASPAQSKAIQGALRKLSTSADDIIQQHCKGIVNRQFPSELRSKTLKEIIDLAKTGDRTARKAKKLLIDKRFQK